jgi:uncharacterized protein (DUF2147 family)
MKTLSLAFVLFLTPLAAAAADIKGKWLTEEGKGRVVFEPCGAKICGKIVWLKQPVDAKTGKAQLDVLNEDASLRTRPVIGIKLGELDADGNGGWQGLMYSPEDGKSYKTEVSLQKDGSLLLKGCIMAGLLCDDQTWTRAD